MTWILPVLVLGAAALAAVLWSYRPELRGGPSARWVAAGFKLTGFLLLLFCLTEPLARRVRARPGANQLLLVVDDSRSLTVRDRGALRTRAEEVRDLVADDAAWVLRAAQDFDLRCFAFDERLRALTSTSELAFAGERSGLARALSRVAKRSAGRPVAGVVLVTDGVATDTLDAVELPWEDLPPIHPVVVGGASEIDVGVTRVEVSQTNFEESPVTLRASILGIGCDGEEVAVELRDRDDVVLERQIVTIGEGRPQEVRFDAPAEPSGIHFYEVRASLVERPLPATRTEATEANNSRWAVVDRGAGPYRVLYVSGRPNWEFKFLSRALAEDPEIELVGLVRIAKREPKFAFRDRNDRRNQLWDGFDNRDEEAAEQYDEPVLLRLNTKDEFELRGGFPRTAEDLFGYSALIVDDLEAGFFTPDQMALIEGFVSRRGAGFLALGGEHAFLDGGYRKTPLGDLLPVYLDAERSISTIPRGDDYGLELTREGWLEPWVRLRSTEELERTRMQAMPAFKTVNRSGAVKPGGIVLIEARDEENSLVPAFVVQRFGKGRSAAMLIGDLWRWDLKRPDHEVSDLGTAWRQVLRWLVSDVPARVDLDLARGGDAREVRLRAVLRDESFAAVHNATVELEVERPDGERFELDAEPSTTEAGTWEASFVTRAAGPYRARLRAVAEDGSELGTDESGWVAEPAAEEFRQLEPDRGLLAEIAERSNGSLVEPDELPSFAADLARQEVPITEEEIDPVWHRWWIFVLALVCFCVEWGVRRVHGLP